jgi:hypothetical protein
LALPCEADRRRLTFDPAAILAGDGGADGAGSKHGLENATDRIPEPVHAPLLVWALRWVDDFADDILRACSEWSALEPYTRKDRIRRPPIFHGVPERLAAVLSQYRAEGRPLPGHHGAVNHSHLAREVQCGDGQLRVPHRWRQIEEAAHDLGVDDHTYLRTDVRGSLDGNPWLPRIPYKDVKLLARLLQTACYIVIAYLSGMRDSEVKHLR